MESFEPVDVDKAGSEASEEGIQGLSKMVALLDTVQSFQIKGLRGFVQKKIHLTM